MPVKVPLGRGPTKGANAAPSKGFWGTETRTPGGFLGPLPDTHPRFSGWFQLGRPGPNHQQAGLFFWTRPAAQPVIWAGQASGPPGGGPKFGPGRGPGPSFGPADGPFFFRPKIWPRVTYTPTPPAMFACIAALAGTDGAFPG